MPINKKEIIKLFKKGLSKRQVAIKCGCSRAYVYEVLTSEGLFTPKQQTNA